MKTAIFWIKLAHTLIFWCLSACVLYSLYSGITGHVTVWTWVATVAIIIEGVVLIAAGWVCPLTLLAERLGAPRGSVVDLFLPTYLADRIFPVCTTLWIVAMVLILWRMVR